MFNLNTFISQHVTKREKSLFIDDIEVNRDKLTEKINNKTVLVIGGAGSIGSSFIKAILPFEPKSLVVVDINENALAELTRDLRSTNGMFIPGEYLPYPMNYSSMVFEKMFRAHNGFDIVANFSAHKHVRSEKDMYSIEAMLRNNVFNAKRLLDLLSQYPPEEYFCVSTDKAANPVNIMGASKRLMEDLIFSYSDRFPVKTARFANVAFSNGSLPAGFLARIAKLQPLSAPSDVKRYFVSPEESGQICMMACMLGNNREIFFPKLRKEQMMRFDTIAEQLLAEHGYEAMKCSSDEEAIEKAAVLMNGSNYYPVHFSESNTSGEKPYEEFFTDDETADQERYRSLGVVTGKNLVDRAELNDYLIEFEHAFADPNIVKSDVVAMIQKRLKNFAHIETGKSLDTKM